MSTPERALRDCLGQFATGVTVVTARLGEEVHGATVGSFTSVSLRPPLVMVSLNRLSRLCALMSDAPFAVNVLGAHQADTALHFANRGTMTRGQVRWEHDGAFPRLAGAVAHFSCLPWGSYDGGDHVLYLGRVVEFGAPGGEPLVFHRGAFRRLAAPPGPPRHGAWGAWGGSLDGPAQGTWTPGAEEVFSPDPA